MLILKSTITGEHQWTGDSTTLREYLEDAIPFSQDNDGSFTAWFADGGTLTVYLNEWITKTP